MNERSHFIGVFAPGRELELAVEALYTMRICNQAVASNVVFSVVMTLSHPPRNHEDLSVYLRKASSHPRVCQSVLSLDDASGVKRKKNYDNLGVSNLQKILINALNALDLVSFYFHMISIFQYL